jgi:DNA-binding MarR family transcriptional regulator
MEPESHHFVFDSDDPQQPPHMNLGYLLPQVAHSLLREFDAMLTTYNIRSTHLGVLSTLRSFGPLSQRRIARYLGLERQTLVNITDELEQRGFLVRKPHLADRRQQLLYLTQAGEVFHSEVDAAAHNHQQEVFGVLSNEEQRILYLVLSKLAPVGHFTTLFTSPDSPSED